MHWTDPNVKPGRGKMVSNRRSGEWHWPVRRSSSAGRRATAKSPSSVFKKRRLCTSRNIGYFTKSSTRVMADWRRVVMADGHASESTSSSVC